MTTKISTDNIQAGALATLGSNPKITQIQICDSSYNVLDDTAIALSGGYVKITGTGFKTGATVTVNRTLATSVTWISSTELRAEVGAQVAGTYVVYVVNTDGSVAIRINALTYSSEPSWTTGSTLIGDSGTAISIQLVATPAVSYSLAAGSTLPTGLTLTSGGLLSGTVNIENETIYSFSVVATDTELQDSPRTFSLTISVGDLYFAATTLLLPGSANTFVRDASTNNFAVTAFGDTRPNNFGPYTPGYYSAYFDAKTDYISVPANASLITFAEDFTFEAWIYPSDTSITYWGIWDSRQSGSTAQAMVFTLDPLASPVTGQGRMKYYNGTSYHSTGIVYYNRWTHVAFVRSGTTMTFYIDGVASGTSTVSGTQTGTATTNPVWIGTKDNGLTSYGSTGYISNFRIVNGTAVYTSNFTPSTAPLTAITNTVLLTCQSNRFIDNSTNNYTLTPSSVSISGFVPYAPNSSYSTYGSAYFDGTGDYLTVPYNTSFLPSSGTDFTAECWIYITGATAVFSHILGMNSNTVNNWFIRNENGSLQGGIGAANGTFGTAVANTWIHLAITQRTNTLYGYINGTQAFTSAISTWNSNVLDVTIGARSVAADRLFTGYISNVRVVKGTAVYTDNFTPPTAPLTAITNTSLLTLQSNQPVNNNAFLDSSTNNLLVTRAGNATQGTFSPYSPSGWSNYFDGTGDYLTLPTNAAFAIGTADFTVEAWVYPSAANQPWSVIFAGVNFGSSSDWGLYLGNSTTALFPRFQFTSTEANSISSSTAVSQNQWSHIAVTRSSGTARMFINGVQTATANASTWSLNNTLQKAIGAGYNGNASTTLTGYISNLRVVSGTALYTTEFTPPTQPLTAVENTVLLTCCDNRFVDNSANNFAITRTGDVRTTNFAPFKAVVQTPVSYSAYFDGSGDQLTLAANNAFQLTGDFTVEAWIYPTVINSFNMVFGVENGSNSDYLAIRSSSLEMAISNTVYPGWTQTFVANRWYHIAVTRSGTTLRAFVNGVQLTLASGTATSSLQYFQSGVPFVVGKYATTPTQPYFFTGYISNARIVKDTAVYTDNFTPPTQPLTAIAGTSLLTCQSASFVDNSTNRFVITAAGNAQPTTVNPFGTTFTNSSGYTAAEYSGSMYFDGNGDYLTTSSTAFDISGSSSWTMQWWIYPTLASTSQFIWQNYTTGGTTLYGQTILLDSNNTILFEVWQGSSAASQFSLRSGTLNINQWHHIAVVKDGSGTNNNKLFINGTLAAQGTWTTHAAPGSTLTYIGARNYNGLKNYFAGYISDLQVIKGTALYTAAFAPPIAPVLPVPNTTLLLNGTSAAIADATTKNDVETIGDVKITQLLSKWGSSSMRFDGTGDYLVLPASSNFTFGTGNFTVECWVNYVAATNSGIFQIGSSIFPLTNGVGLGLDASSRWMLYYANGSAAGTAFGPTTNTWYHVAVVRNSGTTRVYLDGIQVMSVADATNYTGTFLGIAGIYSTSYLMNGYLQDFRVTKGVARYTANFTPPTSAFNIK